MPPHRLQPRAYHAFHCIGADCEDTCCAGWIVQVDKPTYEAYKSSQDPELRPRFQELVALNPAPANDESYGRIVLSGTGCGFLSEGLCSIQARLGEPLLSIMCSKFPRVLNEVDDVWQRSLDFACPEAARVVLLDPNPMEFDTAEGAPHDPRTGHRSILLTSAGDSGKPYSHFHQIRAFVIWLLQYRAWPLWKRMVLLGSFCDELHAMAAAGRYSETPEVLAGCREAVDRDLFGEALANHRPNPAAQLEPVLDMVVARITSDFTPPRFLACYQMLKQGIEWTSQSSMEEIAARYAAAGAHYYAPFLERHEYIWENYLVSYVHRTMFPLGPQNTNGELRAQHAVHSIREQCLLMMAHYAIMQAILVGIGANLKKPPTPEDAILVIQSYSKSFEHSLTFPAKALQILAGAGMGACVQMALLIRSF
jgi:lysine-N-methylase